MTSRRWFHHNITGQAATKLLMDKGRDGSFLCRPSSSNKNDFTLSVRRDGSVTHIKIQNHGDYYDLYGGQPFTTLPDLINFYQKNVLQDRTGEQIQLLYPVNCNPPTTERWFHGHISASDAVHLLLEKGKNCSYLVRESTRNLGQFVITIRSDDHVKHVKVRSIDGKFDVGGEPSFTSISKLIDFYVQHPMVEENGGTVLHLKQPFNTTKFMASSIAERVAELQKNSKFVSGKDGFWEELEHLQQLETRHRYTRKVGMLPANKDKNQFKNIVPFDHNRVILKDVVNDYINASFIKDEYDSTFIACQGCLPATIHDFWLMVYQQNSHIILMVTKEVEKEKVCCAKYWPNLNTTMEINDFKISNQKETETPEFTLRELLVTNTKEHLKAPYIIYQYQYVAWPDKSYPDNVGSVLGILHDVILKQNDCSDAGPPVVHCSTGIGRTAALIVIDMVVRKIQKEGLESELDIQGIVQRVRTQRPWMVQLEAQYKFIYLATAHYIEMMHYYYPGTDAKLHQSHSTSRKHISTSLHDEVQEHKDFPPHRPSCKPPTIAINGTVPPPIPQRKSNDQSMCNIFSRPQHTEDPPPNTPPPIPERKKES